MFQVPPAHGQSIKPGAAGMRCVHACVRHRHHGTHGIDADSVCRLLRRAVASETSLRRHAHNAYRRHPELTPFVDAQTRPLNNIATSQWDPITGQSPHLSMGEFGRRRGRLTVG